MGLLNDLMDFKVQLTSDFKVWKRNQIGETSVFKISGPIEKNKWLYVIQAGQSLKK